MSRMDELDRLASGYGFRPQGKSNPMRSDGGGDRRSASARTSFYDDDHRSAAAEPPPRFDYDSFFNSAPPPTAAAVSGNAGASPGPVYDKPVYDDDLFGGLPGVKSKSMSAGRFEEDGFSSNWGGGSSNDVDLLGKLGGASQEEKKSKSNSVGDAELEFFANLTKRPVPESSRGQSSSNVKNDPFDVFRSTSPSVSSTAGFFIDPLDDIANLGKPSSRKPDNSSGSGGAFDDLDPLGSFAKPSTPMSPEKSSKGKDSIPSRPGTAGNREHVLGSSFKRSESPLQRNGPEDRYQDAPIFDMPSVSVDAQKSSRQKASPPPPFVNPYDAANSQADGSPLFDMPSVSVNAQKSSRQNASSPPFVNPYDAANSQADGSPESEELSQQHDDIWLTVSEIPLFTQPTRAPPPSRPPPSIPRRISKIETGFSSSNARKKNDDFVSPSGYNPYSQSPKGFPQASKEASSIDELEDFAMRKPQHGADEVNFHTGEEMDASSVAAASAAAMKDAMDKAEAKFRHAKEVREREYAKGARNRDTAHVEKDEHNVQDAQEREFRENQERLDQERRQREDEEIEKRRVERERARAREIENARQKQAVERATREARERAGIEARLRAERAAQTEARERSERAAVHRAQAEARERAAAGAKERAEKAAAEARERANAEAKEKEARDRAAVERAAAESRRRSERAAAERAAAEARARAAAQAQEKATSAAQASQQRNDNDLESFFNMNSRPNSAPRPRASSPDAAFDAQFPNPASKAASSNSNASNMRKASSAANIFDGLSSVFEAPSTGGFNEVEGETEERRRARLERHQRTQERAAKALAEKNQRDVQAQREQEERHRIADTLDIEIKRWAAGKEGNLRALLSTLQYVLWPECGWTSVSLTDLITGAQVKKVYRKATLCIHPDKVQQKGANLQQKYIAEKVFDMLKEAWNKFNSEELF